MTPALLADAGRLLFGNEWQSPLARQLGVALRTVQRWASGHSPIPPPLGPELASALEARASELASLPAECRRLAKRLAG